MSKTPRTDKVKMTALTERSYDKIKCVPVELSYKLESELADKEKRLAEANIEIEGLEEEIVALCDQMKGANSDDLRRQLAEARAEIESKNRLVEQMRDALEDAFDHICPDGDPIDARELEVCNKIEAALAAERGEK